MMFTLLQNWPQTTECV